MPRSSMPLTTLRPGEQVRISLTGRAIDAINGWGGRVVAVDQRAIRLEAAWYRFGLGTVATQGERIIPWSRVESIKIEAAS